MKRSSLIMRVFAGLLALSFALVTRSFGQGITTSAISGFVTDAAGKPVSGATVTIVHDETGTRGTVLTQANGSYGLSGLRVGGPYTVSVSAPGLQFESQKDVYLSLGETARVDLQGSTSEIVKLEAFKLTESRDTAFDAGKISTSTSFNARDIGEVATVRRNVQDVAVLDTRMFLNSLDQGGQLSAQGQNFRFNSFLIDGVQANDPFGLNSSGFSSLRSPIPLEAIQSMSLEFNPPDVRRSGFTGALINVVTKSGTNKFSGAAYAEYTDYNMRAKNPVNFAREPFRERTYGLFIGGPIIRNRLFFYLGEEDFRRTSTAPAQIFVPNASTVQQIVTRAKAVGYDPGSFSGATSYSIQKSYVAKLDWNINEKHRLSLQYRDNYGSTPSYVSFNSSGTTTSFSNYWYDAPLHSHGYTAQLFSNWTQNFRTEASIGYTNYNGSPIPRGPAFPEVIIRGVTGVRSDNGTAVTSGQINMGTDASRQLNGIVTKTNDAAISGEYTLGAHTLLFGGDYDKKQVWDAFIQRYYGSYTFSSVADWLAGTNASLAKLTLSPGTSINDALAIYTYTQRGLFAQDTWRPVQRFTMTAGLRFDDPYVPHAPIPIPTTSAFSEASFHNAFGMWSTTTNNGKYTVAPRFGFSYQPELSRKTQIRGGVGLFQGTNPSVWLGNPYQNRGVTSSVTLSGQTFSQTITPPATGAPGIATVNVTDPSFRPPLSWKGNLAIDHNLPFLGFVATIEEDVIVVQRALNTVNLNLKPVGTNPDGRIRYAGGVSASTSASRGSSNSNTYSSAANYQNAGFADVYYLTNTNKGGGHDFTVSLRRPLKDHWAASFAWTRSHYTEVASMTSSVAQSNYNGRKIVNPNDDAASTANTNIPDRVVARLTYQFDLIKKAPTTVSVTYQGRTGHNYSWVYYGDANGDGFTFNDLLYVPTGPSDPKVRWVSNSARDDFFAFAQANGMMKYAGTIVPRNSETSPWTQTFDLKITQAIPLYRNLKTEIYANFLNFANFFSKKWGLLEEVPFSYGRSVLSTTYDATNNQYVYSFTPSTLDPVPTVNNEHPVSRWQIQVGARIRF